MNPEVMGYSGNFEVEIIWQARKGRIKSAKQFFQIREIGDICYDGIVRLFECSEMSQPVTLKPVLVSSSATRCPTLPSPRTAIDVIQLFINRPPLRICYGVYNIS